MGASENKSGVCTEKRARKPMTKNIVRKRAIKMPLRELADKYWFIQ